MSDFQSATTCTTQRPQKREIDLENMLGLRSAMLAKFAQKPWTVGVAKGGLPPDFDDEADLLSSNIALIQIGKDLTLCHSYTS